MSGFFSIILKYKTFKRRQSLHGHKTWSIPITEPLGEEEGFHSPCLLSSLQLTEDQAWPTPESSLKAINSHQLFCVTVQHLSGYCKGVTPILIIFLFAVSFPHSSRKFHCWMVRQGWGMWGGVLLEEREKRTKEENWGSIWCSETSKSVLCRTSLIHSHFLLPRTFFVCSFFVFF